MPRHKQFDETQVLNKAIDLFWEKGYNGTSVQDLVNHLGINRASMYDTFGDKHQLFIAALKRYRQDSFLNVKALLEENIPIRSKLGRLFDYAIQESMADKERKGCFLVNAASELVNCDQKVEQIIQENDAAFEEALYLAFQKAQTKKEISDRHDPRALARFVFNNINGLRILGKSKPDRSTLEDIKKVILSVIDH